MTPFVRTRPLLLFLKPLFVAFSRLGLIVLTTTFLLASAQAQNAETPNSEPSYVDESALEILFSELKLAPNQAEADSIAAKIWVIWFDPDLPRLAGLMNLVTAARQIGDIPRSIRILDNIIEQFPSYAEAWNQRATMYFLIGNFDASLADVDEVLAREPRHFGALSGQAVMYFRRGEKALALQSILNALQFHPFLSERAMFDELLEPPTRT